MFGAAFMDVIRYGRIAAYLRRTVSLVVASALIVCIVGHAAEAASTKATATSLFTALVQDDDSAAPDRATAECCDCICAHHAFLSAIARIAPSAYSATVVPVGRLVSLHDSSLATESPPPRT